MKLLKYISILLAGVLIMGCTQQADTPDNKATQSKAETAPDSYLKVYEIEGSYEDVREDLESAITGKGIVISGISHISEMLQRTGKDLGLGGPIFSHAEAINFCSATISRNMMKTDPTNIVFCPYIIAIYSLPNDDNKVYIAYRRPPVLPTKESTEALAAVENLLKSIIEDVAM